MNEYEVGVKLILCRDLCVIAEDEDEAEELGKQLFEELLGFNPDKLPMEAIFECESEKLDG